MAEKDVGVDMEFNSFGVQRSEMLVITCSTIPDRERADCHI